MLQQTPAIRVAPQWKAWVERWPDVFAVAHAKRSDILRQWDKLGYPNRALRLHESAKIIVTKFSGVVPNDEEILRTLPGVGEYTAAAICSFAYKKETVVLDTNIRRVIGRIWSGVENVRPAISSVERELARSLIPERKPHSIQWAGAVMEFGALVCTAKKPACQSCFVRTECNWRLAGYPKSDTQKRSQKFVGTDRQVRGRIMEIVRKAAGSVTENAFDEVCSDAKQKDRALLSLLTDGLVEITRSGRYRLPR